MTAVPIVSNCPTSALAAKVENIAQSEIGCLLTLSRHRQRSWRAMQKGLPQALFACWFGTL
jgi:hypothetical protein